MFDWDDGNVRHIRLHGVRQEECEAVLNARGRRVRTLRTVNGEVRLSILGRTETGRLLFVVVTAREDRLRVVTAYDASRKDRRWFEATP